MKTPSQDDLELVYDSPSGHSLLYKGVLGERIVVLKCLKPAFRGNPLYESILRHEYEIAHPLKHPGVCDHLSWLRSPELGNCIVLEWIDGDTLEVLASEGKLDEKASLGIVLQLCDALSYIHRKGVLHNDMKPENIMVTGSGSVVKVLDFSLADSPSMAMGHLPGGTEGYAAPEVVPGGEATASSDIFSLGKIIALLLPSRNDVSGRCCKEDPVERFASVEEVKSALLSRRRLAWWTLVLAAAALALAIVLYYLPHGRNHGATDDSGNIFTDALALVKAAGSQALILDASEYSFTDTLDCFNGRFIVSCEDGKGLMDLDGNLLLTPEYSEIEFLSPEVALLAKHGLHYLCSADGRIFAEDPDGEALCSTFEERYEAVLFERLHRWDEVLDCLDSLCWLSLGPDGDKSEVQMFERLRGSLELVSGNMSAPQAQRLAGIEERFGYHGKR